MTKRYKDDLLNEREKIHGDWSHGAEVFAALFAQIRDHGENLDASQFKALVMIALKIERVLTGNANEPDHWLDIAGYANLVRENMVPVPATGQSPLASERPAKITNKGAENSRLVRAMRLLAKPPVRGLAVEAQIKVSSTDGFLQTYTALKKQIKNTSAWLSSARQNEVKALLSRFIVFRDALEVLAEPSVHVDRVLAACLIHYVNRGDHSRALLETVLNKHRPSTRLETEKNIEAWVLNEPPFGPRDTVELQDPQAQGLDYRPEGCFAKQHADFVKCELCDLSWDVNELLPPACGDGPVSPGGDNERES